jgi:heme exporter protein B
MLPLLMLPVLAPVLLAGARGFEIALGRGVGGGWQWAGMLGIVAGVYLALGIAVWGPLLEDT